MAITLRRTSIDTSGKTTELSYQEMNNNLKSYYYSSSLSSNTLNLHFLSGSSPHAVDLSGLSSDSIYTADGTLTGNRTLEAGGSDLTFNMTTANLIIQSDNAQRITITDIPTANASQVLGIDSFGTVRAMNTSSIAGGGSTSPGGSDKQVQYNNGGSFGGSTLYFDDVNNRLGIGESSPDRPLHITDGNPVALRLENTASLNVGIQFFGSDSTGTGAIIRGTGNNFELLQHDSTLQTNLYISASGEVHLSRLAAGEKADVVGYDRTTGQLTFYSTASFGGGSGTPGGSDGQVQYNNGGAFGGESTFTYDDGNNTLTIQGATNQPSIVLSNAQSVAISNGSQLSEIQTFYSTNEVGTVAFVAEGAFNPSDTPTRLELRTTNDGASSPTTKFQIKNDGKLIADEYGSGTFTGTATKYLAVDSSGNVIEEDVPSSGANISRVTPTTTHTFNTKITNNSNYLWNLELGSGAPSGNGKMRIGMTSSTKDASTVTTFEFDRDSSTGNRDVTLDYLQEDGRIVLRNSSGTIVADGWDIKEVDTSNAAYVKVYVGGWTGGSVTLNSGTDYRVDFISDARIPLADASYNNITLQNESATATNAVLVANDSSTFGDYTLVEVKSNASNSGDVYVWYARLSEGSTTTFNDYPRRATFLNGVADTVTQLTVSDANDVALLEFRVVNYGNLSLALMGCDKIKGS